MAGGGDPKWQKDAADQNFDYMFKLLIIGNSSVGTCNEFYNFVIIMVGVAFPQVKLDACRRCLVNERQSDSLIVHFNECFHMFMLSSFMLQVKQVSFSVTPMIRLHRRLCQQLVLISK